MADLKLQFIPIDYLYSFEFQGRNLASAPSIRKVGELYRWLDGMAEALKALNNFFYDASKLVSLHDPQKGEDLEVIVYNLISPFSIFIAEFKKKVNEHLKYGLVSPRMSIEEYFRLLGESLYGLANEKLKTEICGQCKLVVGETCCWVSPEDEYDNPVYLLNDITIVYHRILLLYVQFTAEYGDIYWLSDKSKYSSTTSELALETLVLWDRTIHMGHKLNIYDLKDYDALTSFAFDNIVELRVGSASGHLTKIDLNANRVDYYDNDIPVVSVIAKMFNYIGGELVSFEYNHAVYTFLPNKYREVALIMAMATSMDFRVEDALEAFWPRLWLKSIDYEAYLITKNYVYWHEEFENVRSIDDVRELDHKNFIESIMGGYFTGFFSQVMNQALAYAREFPEAYHDLLNKAEQIWTLGDKAYRILREEGIIEEAVRIGIRKGMWHVDNYLVKYLSDHHINLYRDIMDAMLEFIARAHWYYLKALVASGLVAP